MTKTIDRSVSRRELWLVAPSPSWRPATEAACITISASNSSEPLGQDALVTLAKAAAGRIG